MEQTEDHHQVRFPLLPEVVTLVEVVDQDQAFQVEVVVDLIQVPQARPDQAHRLEVEDNKAESS